MDPVFKIGDSVTFELASGRDHPRWSYEVDLGESGKWAFATIDIVNKLYVGMTFSDLHGAYDTWCWPLKGDAQYVYGQWGRPGYLRHANRHEITLHNRVELAFDGTNV